MKIIVYLPEKQEIEVTSMDRNLSNDEIFQELIGNPKEFVVLGNIAVNKGHIIAVRLLPDEVVEEPKKECDVVQAVDAGV